VEEAAQVILPDLTNNAKQAQFVDDVLSASAGMNDYRYICYGGGAGSGKTFAVLTALVALCSIYPGSRWAVFRASNTNLEKTTIPSVDRILAGNPRWRYSGAAGNMQWRCSNGSAILFISENYNADPDLNHVLGLEISGAVMEQAEELSEKLFDVLKTRIGRWKGRKIPKPMILLTLNPANNWVKTMFYDPWEKGELQPPLYFKPALVYDNVRNLPNGEDYIKAMDSMPERIRNRLRDGKWTGFIDESTLWAYSFSRDKHIARDVDDPKWDGVPGLHLWMSCDQNVNPLTVTIIQQSSEEVRVLDCIKLANSDVYAMCALLRKKYPKEKYSIRVCGDRSGNNRSVLAPDGMTFYKIMKRELGLADTQFYITNNPPLADNQILVNGALEKMNIKIHPVRGRSLIWDLENVQSMPDGTIKKMDRSDPAQQADCLDTFRYWININVKPVRL
jgi:hypothetical protein